MKPVYALALLVLVQFSECYNILVIFGHPGKSHYDVFKTLFQALGNRGHNITIISHGNTAGVIKNGRHVLLSKESLTGYMNLGSLPGGRIQKYLEIKLFAELAQFTCQSSLESENLQKFLEEDHQFDVILFELFNTNCFYGLINKYKAPFIGLSSCAMLPWHPQFFGSPENPSYIPSMYMAHLPPMTFMERVENTFVHLGHKLWYKLILEKTGTKLSKKYTGYEPADPYNASLFLINTHHSLHGARPLTPAIVEVGGIHVSTKIPKELPEDIEKWTNDSSSGLIYFSLGSSIKGHTFPEEQLKTFQKVLSESPQRVLWKWENETMSGKPDNVMLTSWAPQFDILSHPNTKLFISHGGLLGITEAVHLGVPVLVMPQFGDQPLNARALEKNGAGVILTVKEATEEQFRKALEQALSLKTKRNAKELSQRFRDRLRSPLETAIYWVEHIARYKGGSHMRSAAIDMPFYQYLLLDVVAFLSFGVLILTLITYKSLMLIIRRCIKSKQKLKKS